LLLLLDEVGAADKADSALLAEAGEEGEDIGGGTLGRCNDLVVSYTTPVSFLGFPSSIHPLELFVEFTPLPTKSYSFFFFFECSIEGVNGAVVSFLEFFWVPSF